MSRQEEIAEAVDHHRSGRIEEARRIYARILAEDPDCPEALNFLGVMHSQHGNPEVAAGLLQRAVQAAPHYTDAHINFGNVLVELDHRPEAITSYENALLCDPDDVIAHNNLGALLRHEGELHRALQHVLRAISLRPAWAVAHMNAGNVYALMGYTDRALSHYRRAVDLDPRLSDAQRILGHHLAARGDQRSATDVFRHLVAIDPGNVVARHMLAALSGRDVPYRASSEYVEQTFDQFASSFEHKLERLEYRAPRLIADEVSKRLPESSTPLRVLDLGCGTGLCAPYVSDRARELVGVDLSGKMLEKAAARDLYDELTKADLVEYLDRGGEPFDLMISADVLIYFGAIDAVLRGASRRLAANGWLLFTLEKWEARSGESSGYSLQPHGRYAHSRAYVEEQVSDAGLELVALEEEVLRNEMQQPVAGWLASARKPAAASDQRA